MKTTHIELLFRPQPVDPNGNGERHYVCWTLYDRRFNVRAYPDGRLLLEEYIPNGAYYLGTQNGSWQTEEIPGLRPMLADPNGLHEWLARHHIDPDRLIRESSAAVPDARYYRDWATVKTMILRALEYNIWYDAGRPPQEHPEVAVDEIPDAPLASEFRKNEPEPPAAPEPEPLDLSVLDRCDSLGLPLSPAARQILTRFLHEPSPETWDAAHNLMVVNTRTCWNIWIRHVPSAPRVRPRRGEWVCAPRPDSLLRWIDQEIRNLEARRHEAVERARRSRHPA